MAFLFSAAVEKRSLSKIDVLAACRAVNRNLPVLITAHGTVEAAVKAIRKGAFDFMTKAPHLTFRSQREEGRRGAPSRRRRTGDGFRVWRQVALGAATSFAAGR